MIIACSQGWLNAVRVVLMLGFWLLVQKIVACCWLSAVRVVLGLGLGLGLELGLVLGLGLW